MSRAVAPWLAQSKARIFFDMHLPAWPGKGIAEKFVPREIAEAIAASGADSAVLFAKCQYGNFYTRVAGETLHPGLGGTDLLAETAAALREKGVRTLAYYSVSWDERHADLHPQWLAWNSSGAPGAVGPGTSRWRTLCINSPYADLVDAHLRWIAGKEIDGIWLDMTIVGEGNCYCPRCRAGFAAKHGRDIPLSAADPAWPAFLRFRGDMVETLYARLRASIRSVAPALSFTNNYWGYPWTSGEMGSRAVGATREVDFLTGEAYADWTGIRSSSLLPIFLRSVAAGRPFESLIGTGVNTWDYTRKPRAYLAYEACAVFAHGATVTVDDEPFHDGSFDASLYRDDLRDIFRDISAARRSVEGTPVRYAAVYHSQAAKDLCHDQQDFVKDICGGFRLLRDLHLPVEFLFDETGRIPDATDVPLVVLAGVNAVRGEEWRRLARYMEGGGLVLAAGGLGGDPDTMRSLAALGIEGSASSAFSLSYLRLPGHGNRDILVRGRAAAFRAGAVLPPGSAQGEIIDPICETSPLTFFHNNLPAPHRPTAGRPCSRFPWEKAHWHCSPSRSSATTRRRRPQRSAASWAH